MWSFELFFSYSNHYVKRKFKAFSGSRSSYSMVRTLRTCKRAHIGTWLSFDNRPISLSCHTCLYWFFHDHPGILIKFDIVSSTRQADPDSNLWTNFASTNFKFSIAIQIIDFVWRPATADTSGFEGEDSTYSYNVSIRFEFRNFSCRNSLCGVHCKLSIVILLFLVLVKPGLCKV